MGLFCGSRIFRKNGKFYILKAEDVIYPTEEDIEQKLPIFYGFDAMCRLTGLQGIGQPAPMEPEQQLQASGWILGHQASMVPNKKRKMDTTPLFTPNQIAEALFRPLITFVRCHPHADVTIGLMCDVSADVPKEKYAVQVKRTRSASARPYQVDLNAQKVAITTEGLCIDEKSPQPIDMYAMMATRPLRPHLYAFLRKWILTRKWKINFTLIFDADFPEVGHMAYQYNIKADQETEEVEVPHSQTGEGEISALVWGLRFKDTHLVQLHSGDLDMLALLLIHGHKFKHPVRGHLCGKYSIDYRHAVNVLKEQDFLWQDIVMGAIMLGTDYVVKKLVTHRANDHSVFEAARTWRLINNNNMLLDLALNCDIHRVSDILTAANNVFREDRKMTKKGESLDLSQFPPPVTHSRIAKRIQFNGWALQKFRVNLTEKGLAQILFNLRYWTQLIMKVADKDTVVDIDVKNPIEDQ